MAYKNNGCDDNSGSPRTVFGTDEAFMNRVPRKLRDQITKLREQQQDKIAEGLRSEDVQELFLRDPAAALERLGVEMPRDLRKRLRRAKGLPELESMLKPAPIRLPNGKTITPKVRIRITDGKGS